MKEETFSEVYERYAAMIMKSVMTQTNDEDLAKEICQKTFLAYFRKMETLDHKDIKYWLLHVAKNHLIDHWRRCGTRNEVMEENDNGAMVNVVSPENVEKRGIDKLFVCEILEDLKRENQLWYDAIDYIIIREEGYEEAAKQLGTDPAALRARVYRAKQYIRAKFGKDYFPLP